ncbi:MAG: YdaU family protein [Luteimonas sp.]
MNFYKHHIGDYSAATAHLSFVEDAAYSRLLRIYYRDERPLPCEIKAVQRLAGARSKEEREAVDVVLREFFDHCDDGWRSKRADEEIEKAQAQAETNRQIAVRREAARRATTDTRLVERNEHEPCNESSASREPSHKPDTREELIEPNGSSGSADADPPRCRTEPIPYQAIVDAYNGTMTGLAKVREVTAKRRTLIRGAWQASPERRSTAFWPAYFAECQADDFLNGTGPYRNGHENWRPDFNFLLRADTVTRVFEVAMDRVERDQ